MSVEAKVKIKFSSNIGDSDFSAFAQVSQAALH